MLKMIFLENRIKEYAQPGSVHFLSGGLSHALFGWVKGELNRVAVSLDKPVKLKIRVYL
jgi:hypothetical protein